MPPLISSTHVPQTPFIYGCSCPLFVEEINIHSMKKKRKKRMKKEEKQWTSSPEWRGASGMCTKAEVNQ
jgi:hypothetical protein